MKNTRKVLVIIALIAVIGFVILPFTGCDNGTTKKTLTGIEVTTPPTKNTYDIGETLNTDGMVVRATYSNGSTEIIDNGKLTISALDSATAGEKTITVIYKGKTDEFKVTVRAQVIAPDLESIEVTLPTKVRYNLGEDLNLAGMVVTATYSDESTAAVTGYTTDTSAYDKNAVGHHKIIVTYNGKTAEFTVNVIDPTIPTVAKPTASPAGFGLYTEVQTVTLTTTPSDANIYYTTDDTEPTDESTLYDGPITVDKSMRIRAFAVKEGYNDSDELNVTYTLQVTRPYASVQQGTYTRVLEVTLSDVTEGAAIYYTIDGTNPSASSTLYTGEISINTTTTLKIIGIKAGWDNSIVLSVTYTLNLPFTTAPVLELEPGNGKIIYTWTASAPEADSYDVYWKEGENLTAAAIKDGGTKITGATSGGEITGLTNNTAYSVLVTAIKASYANKDSEVASAIPVALVYNITGSGSSFTATKNGAAFGTTGAIQSVIDAIKADAAGKDCIIDFGDGTTALDIGTTPPSFSGTGWGNFVELSGKITGSSTGTTTGTIVIADAVSINSVADIENTTTTGVAVYHNSTGTLHITGGTVANISNNATARAIYNASTGAVNISGGEVKADTGSAVYNASTGKITVSGTAKVTSANVSTTAATSGTISIQSANTAIDPRLVIEGGTVENTATGSNGRAVFNNSTGAVNISGGTVQGNTGNAIYYTSTGAVNISGGEVKAGTGIAVYVSGAGKITVSETAKVTSANAANNTGTIYLASSCILEINGGTVENTANNSNAMVIFSYSTSTINVSGGTVQATGTSNGYAINNYLAGGSVNISSGTVLATSGTAVYNYAAGAINISGGTVSATGGTSSRAVTNYAGGTVTISGGTVSATGAGHAVANNANTGVINISGGSVSATSGYAVYNYNAGTVTISGGTVSATSGSAVYNNTTGSVTISSGTVSATSGYAVYNNNTGKITVSQTAGATLITSANTTAAQGTIFLNAPTSDNTNLRLEITGGIVENTGANGRAIYNASKGAVTISAGTVRAIGSGTVYSVYGANATPGELTITSPPAVIVGNTFPKLFTDVPALTLVPGNGTIAYTWTTPTITPDSYDVYWKAGILSVADVKTGTKITNASSGGTINGLANGTTYSVVVTANKATSSGIDSSDSWVLAAKPGSPLYTITGSSTAFNATKKTSTTAETVGTADQPIQTVINAIRTDAAQSACIIQFGDGSSVLDTGTTAVSFNNTNGTWGTVEISGKITGNSATATIGTIVIEGSVSITSGADIANTAASTNARAIYNASTGSVNISGGTVQATGTSGKAVYNYAAGTINISGGTVRATGTSGSNAVHNYATGTINISGGTVQATATTGNAVYNYIAGAINISGGTVSATTGSAVYNAYSSTGTVSISGGTVSTTTGWTVYNAANTTGKITVSQPTATATLITSANTNTDASGGTIYITGGTDNVVRLEITGGTVQNTSTGTNGNAVSNESASAITMSGGTVSTTATSGRAILNYSTGTLTVSGGTVSATGTSGRAIHNESTGTISITGGTVTAPVNSTAYAIYINDAKASVTVTAPPAVIVGERYTAP
ncbi:hypothetical protein R84B8_00204 [Treponema sp. R8-4-B8]